MTTIPIKTATTADVDQAIAVVVLAFIADPIARWVYPDPHQYLTHFPDFVRIFGGKAFEQQTASYVEGFSGAALWLPPGIQPEEETLVPLLQRTVLEHV